MTDKDEEWDHVILLVINLICLNANEGNFHGTFPCDPICPYLHYYFLFYSLFMSPDQCQSQVLLGVWYCVQKDKGSDEKRVPIVADCNPKGKGLGPHMGGPFGKGTIPKSPIMWSLLKEAHMDSNPSWF